MLDMIEPQAIELTDMVIVESIIDLPPTLATANQPHLPQSTQLMGHSRLGHLKFRGNIPDIHLAFQQNRYDSQTGGVAECAEEISQVGGGLFS